MAGCARKTTLKQTPLPIKTLTMSSNSVYSLVEEFQLANVLRSSLGLKTGFSRLLFVKLLRQAMEVLNLQAMEVLNLQAMEVLNLPGPIERIQYARWLAEQAIVGLICAWPITMGLVCGFVVTVCVRPCPVDLFRRCDTSGWRRPLILPTTHSDLGTAMRVPALRLRPLGPVMFASSFCSAALNEHCCRFRDEATDGWRPLSSHFSSGSAGGVFLSPACRSVEFGCDPAGGSGKGSSRYDGN